MFYPVILQQKIPHDIQFKGGCTVGELLQPAESGAKATLLHTNNLQLPAKTVFGHEINNVSYAQAGRWSMSPALFYDSPESVMDGPPIRRSFWPLF
jgi:hypothetical protein